MSIQIPSGQQQSGCSLWWVIVLALIVAGTGLILALRPWEEQAARVISPTPVPGWEAYQGALATAGTLIATGREGAAVATPTAVVVPVPQVATQPVVLPVPQVATQPVVLPAPQVATQPVVLPVPQVATQPVVLPVPQVAVQPVVPVPQVAVQPVVPVPQVAVQPVVLPAAGSTACPQCAFDPAFAEAYATWYREYMAWHSEYTAWYQAWMAQYGGRPQPTMGGAAWQPGAGPAQGLRPGPMPGPGCGPQPGRPGQPWAYTR